MNRRDPILTKFLDEVAAELIASKQAPTTQNIRAAMQRRQARHWEIYAMVFDQGGRPRKTETAQGVIRDIAVAFYLSTGPCPSCGPNPQREGCGYHSYHGGCSSASLQDPVEVDTGEGFHVYEAQCQNCPDRLVGRGADLESVLDWEHVSSSVSPEPKVSP